MHLDYVECCVQVYENVVCDYQERTTVNLTLLAMGVAVYSDNFILCDNADCPYEIGKVPENASDVIVTLSNPLMLSSSVMFEGRLVRMCCSFNFKSLSC